jgi:hypothetical protein
LGRRGERRVGVRVKVQPRWAGWNHLGQGQWRLGRGDGCQQRGRGARQLQSGMVVERAS